jgi:hypothetical protein
MRFAAVVVVFAATLSAAVPAFAQAPSRIRGTIVAVDATTMALKSRDGRDLTLKLADNLGVAVAKAARFEDIKEGDYVGSATRKNANGDAVALEVHYLAPTTAPGHIAWDLEPGTQMTNANVVSKVVGTADHQLVLKYPDGEQKIVVPVGVPIVRAVPGTRADLVPGEYVFVAAQTAPDGTITAQRIQVSKDGVRPPQ